MTDAPTSATPTPDAPTSATPTPDAPTASPSTSETTPGARHDGRAPDQLRDVRITRGWLDHAAGSVLIEFGRTRVLCAASFQPGVPRWLKGQGTGWVRLRPGRVGRSPALLQDFLR